MLVGEDSEDALLVQVALQQAGLSSPVYAAKTADEAIAYLQGERAGGGGQPLPFLVILNQRDYGNENLDVLRWMRTNPVLCDTPVIVLAARKFPDEVLEARRLCASWYAVSPEDFPHLLEWAETVSYRWVRKHSAPQTYARLRKLIRVFTRSPDVGEAILAR